MRLSYLTTSSHLAGKSRRKWHSFYFQNYFQGYFTCLISPRVGALLQAGERGYGFSTLKQELKVGPYA